MIARRYRLAVVSGVLILVGWLLLFFVWPDGPQEPIAIGILLGTMFGQTTVASVWAALGPGWLSWRLPLSLGWVGTIVAMLAGNFARRQELTADVPIVFAACLATQWVAIQLLLWGLVLGYGLRLTHVDEAAQSLHRRSRQFGIRQLMIITLVVGIVLGIGRATLLNFGTELRGHDWIIFLFLAVAAIVVTLPVLLAGLLPRMAVPAVLICLIFVGLATMWELPLLQNFGNVAGPSESDFIWINVATLIWIVAFLIAVRLCGYGLASPKSPSLNTGPT